MKNLRLILILVIISIIPVTQVIAGDWKKIKIATEGAYPPWNSMDKSGNLVGFDIDLAKDLCQRMKLECEIIPQKWRAIIKGLNQGKYDAIMAAVSITEPRKELVSFSRAYADAPNIFVVRKDHPLANFRSTLKHLSLNDVSPAEQALLDSIINEFRGKKIGVQVQTIFQRFADRYLGDYSDIRIYDFQYTIDLDLWQGRLDALIGDMAYYVPFIQTEQGKDYKIIEPYMTGGPFGEGIGVAVRHKDQDLVEMFSSAIGEALADGTVKELAIKWFGFDVSAHE